MLVKYVCDHKCSDKGNLSKHIALVHERKKTYMCDICYRKFAEKQSLNRHIASVHGEMKMS